MENYIFKKVIILSMCNLSKKLMVVVFRGVSNYSFEWIVNFEIVE